MFCLFRFSHILKWMYYMKHFGEYIYVWGICCFSIQYVKHLFQLYLNLITLVFMKILWNCCKMDIRLIDMGKLRMYYGNMHLINTIYPPKPKVRLSQHAIYQPPLISNIEVTKITSTVNSLETQIQTMQICKLIIQNSIIQLSIQNRSWAF